MTEIRRDVNRCSDESYDLIIIGGGIYGIMLVFEAVRRNLRPLILEKNDFISATSLNHHRTVHGGLRYLQSLDILRFLESVGERKWFLKYFPQFVKPMPCLMTLYGKGLFKNPILRLGLLANDILSFYRNFSVGKDSRIPRGKVIYPKKTKKIFHDVDTKGLKGSALWRDAQVEEHQRLMMEVLKLAVASGADALNYVGVKKLLTDKNKNSVIGVQAVDEETGKEYEFHAPTVINAAGPWSRDVAELFDRDHEYLFKKRLLLWNVLFNRDALSDHALALSSNGKERRYFFLPWKNRLLVGTGEMPLPERCTETEVPDPQMETFIKEINTMVPGLDIKESDIQRIYSGILPANAKEQLANRPAFIDHSGEGGPKGLFSISGVKFTTSRLVADKTLNKVFPGKKKMPHEKILEKGEIENLSFNYHWEPSNDEDLKPLKTIIQNESVLHLSDLILRRTSLGDNPERAIKILPKIKGIFNWGKDKWDEEVEDLKKFFEN